MLLNCVLILLNLWLMFLDRFCIYFSLVDFVEEDCIFKISLIIEVKVFKKGVIVLVIFFIIVVNFLLLIFLRIVFLVESVEFCEFIFVKKDIIKNVCSVIRLIFMIFWVGNIIDDNLESKIKIVFLKFNFNYV